MEKKLNKEKQERIENIIRNGVICSAGTGLVPFPVIDMLALNGIQLAMISKICDCYDMEFKENLGKGIVGALVGSMVPGSMARGTFGSIVKAIPVVGAIAGAVLLPTISGASTYALAQVFIQHFESGGTFLDFKPEDFKNSFGKHVKDGKKYVSDVASKVTGGKSSGKSSKSKTSK